MRSNAQRMFISWKVKTKPLYGLPFSMNSTPAMQIWILNPVICRNSIFSATRRLRSWKQMCKKACRILWVWLPCSARKLVCRLALWTAPLWPECALVRQEPLVQNIWPERIPRTLWSSAPAIRHLSRLLRCWRCFPRWKRSGSPIRITQDMLLHLRRRFAQCCKPILQLRQPR